MIHYGAALRFNLFLVNDDIPIRLNLFLVNDDIPIRLNLFLVSDDIPICSPILTFKCPTHSP